MFSRNQRLWFVISLFWGLVLWVLFIERAFFVASEGESLGRLTSSFLPSSLLVLIWLVIFTGHAFCFVYLFERFYKREERALDLKGGVLFVVLALVAFAVSCVTSTIAFLLGSPFWYIFAASFFVTASNRPVFLENTIIPALLFLFFAVCFLWRGRVADKVEAILQGWAIEVKTSLGDSSVISGISSLWLSGILIDGFVIGFILAPDDEARGRLLLLNSIRWSAKFALFVAAALGFRCATLKFKRLSRDPKIILPSFSVLYLLVFGIAPAQLKMYVWVSIPLFFLFRAILRRE